MGFDIPQNSNQDYHKDKPQVKPKNVSKKLEKNLGANLFNFNELPSFNMGESIFTKFPIIAKPDVLRVKKPMILPQQDEKDVSAEIRRRTSLPPKIPTSYSVKFNIADNLFPGTAEDLDACLAKTKLKGMGKDFIEIQNEFGINALFLMSIAKVESGYGNAPMKNKPYNIVGAVGQNPKSYKECIYKLARNLRKNYVNSNLKNPKDISTKYCNGNNQWPKDVVDEMSKLSKKILKLYE